MRKIIVAVSSLILIIITIVILIVTFLLKNNGLSNFKFINVSSAGLNFYIYYEKVNNAVNYEVSVYDDKDKIIYKENTKNTSKTIELKSLENGKKYKIIVIAIDRNGNRKSIKKPYTFLWDELAFSSDNKVLLTNNQNYKVKFTGNYKKKKYKLCIKENNRTIDIVDIKDDSYIIDRSIFEDKEIKLNLTILEDDVPIANLDLFNNISPISDIKILTPNNGDIKRYGDITLTFEGGENASNYLLELYSNNKLLKRTELDSKSIVLSSELFEKAASYKAKITASYFDYINYSKTNEVSFTIEEKETLKPVYTNVNYRMVKKGTNIELLSPNESATIYYTVDGSDPNEFSKVYSKPIKIDNDTVIKAVCKEKNKNDSIISTFNFKIGEKKEYKVYLSASNQYANLGVSEVGYTNEKKEMNDLSDYIEKKLESYGVKVYRNEYGGIDNWTKDSNYLGVDLHLAIHSNASEDHTAYGVETWIHSETSSTYSLAQLIQNNLMSIYYNKEDSLSNRGVKYAEGSLAEVNPSYVPFGILIEVAHHDYLNDAKWIMENKELIGNNIAESILKYFQIK